MAHSLHWGRLTGLLIGCWLVSVQAQSPVNQGLVGVGRLSANLLDVGGQDTLGGFGSGLSFDPTSWSRSGTNASAYTYSGRINAVPDRGPGSSYDYHPRRLTFQFTFTPYYGSTDVAQTQFSATNTSLSLFTYGSTTNFTGADANSTSATNFPQSTSGSAGLGHRSLDPEGIARAADGTFYVCDEYGPNIYHFDATGHLLNTLIPPAALVPKVGSSYPRANDFTEQSDPDSGRYGGRGLEGVALTPDGKQIVGLLQSPNVQDGSDKNGSINTRLLVFNVDATSTQLNTLVAEYVYQLSLNGNDVGSSAKSTPVNEILAINNTQFLVIEHDTRGLGGDSGAFLYKRVNFADISHATNIAGTGYDRELGAPGQLSLPKTGNPSGVTPAAKTTLVDLLDGGQLGKYGLNTNTSSQNQNTLPESFEGLALIPVSDPLATNDYFLVVANDNNFTASSVIVNGVAVDSNGSTVDTLFLVYRVTLPGASVPQPSLPTVTTAAADNIGVTTGRLNGTVNPNNLAASVQFAYGITTNYGSLTTIQNVSATNAVLSVSATVSTLSAATTYHYCIIASNVMGVARGTDQQFPTTAGAPTAVTVAATAVNSYSAVLNGLIQSNGLTTTWWFDFGTNTSYGFSLLPQQMIASNVTLSVTALKAGTTYHFRVDAANSAGTVNGADQIFTTNPFVDSDGDGLPDDYEIANGLNPHDPSDGPTHLLEYLTGTPSFEIASLIRTGADVVITFDTAFAKTYDVQTATNPSNSWSDIPGASQLAGIGVPLSITNFGAALISPSFYRIRLVP